MAAEPGGWHTAEAPVPAGTAYHFVMPDGLHVPDPAGRLQFEDVHGGSEVVDPTLFAWEHGDWTGRPWNEAVIYECHAGLMGGFKGVQERLPELKRLGFTVIELMPIADVPGDRNWGYDGVLPYSPTRAYGSPDELKALVDAAHGLGLMMMLDVVYNQFGPDGAYIHAYAKPFFRDDIKTPWGAAIDFRRPEVRDYFERNALFWLNEYRFDGLRFDAVHAISEGFPHRDGRPDPRRNGGPPRPPRARAREQPRRPPAHGRRAVVRRAMGRRHASCAARAAGA